MMANIIGLKVTANVSFIDVQIKFIVSHFKTVLSIPSINHLSGSAYVASFTRLTYDVPATLSYVLEIVVLTGSKSATPS